MKQYSLVALLLLLASLASAQATVAWDSAVSGTVGTAVKVGSDGKVRAVSFSPYPTTAVHVASYSEATGALVASATYSMTGQRTPPVADLALDSNNVSYVVFPHSAGLTVASYSSSLSLNWTQQITPPSGYTYTEVQEVIANGELYLLLESTNATSPSSTHIALVEVNTLSGAILDIQSSSGTADVPTGMALNGTNVYVSGSSRTPIVATLFEFSSGGSGTILETTYPTVGGVTQLGSSWGAITADSGQLYLTGYQTTLNGGTVDVCTTIAAAFGSGSVNWYLLDEPAGSPAHENGIFGQKIALDGSGNLYVGCYSTAPVSGSIGSVLFQYTTSGGLNWVTYPATGPVNLSSLAADSTGCWFATASSSPYLSFTTSTASSQLISGGSSNNGFVALGPSAECYWLIGAVLYRYNP